MSTVATQKKLTKRQRKALRTKPSAVVQYSLDKGKPQKVGSAVYLGANPEYTFVQPDPKMPGSWVKTAKGIPFVRAA